MLLWFLPFFLKAAGRKRSTRNYKNNWDQIWSLTDWVAHSSATNNVKSCIFWLHLLIHMLMSRGKGHLKKRKNRVNLSKKTFDLDNTNQGSTRSDQAIGQLKPAFSTLVDKVSQKKCFIYFSCFKMDLLENKHCSEHKIFFSSTGK